jgi:hypothetical protein
MTWNYRVIRKTKRVKFGDNYKIVHTHDIHEVYYNSKGKPTKWTVEPVSANGYEGVKEMQQVLCTMLKDALEFPVMEIRKNKLIERSGVER